MKILTTLAEHRYFLGLAALLNSMVAHGTHVDKVIVGYRDQIPSWIPNLTPSTNGQSFRTKCGLEVELVELNGNLHMVHEKPRWLLHVSEVLAPGADEYFFIDSDITINARMSFLGEWVSEGVAICGDVNFIFSRHHPLRKKWTSYAAKANRPIINKIDHYYNSGFLGWTQETLPFIHDWNSAFEMMVPYSGRMDEFRVYDRTASVQSTNQDSLNLAVMITEQPLALIGPEAMGFIYGMRLMHHPIGVKPWTRSFIIDFFKGKPPRESDIVFWERVNGSELNPISKFKAAYMIILCKALRLGGRFYRGMTF